MKIIPLLFSYIATVSVLSAGEVMVGRMRVTLPDGFRHVPAKGIDTVVGSFQPEDSSFEIRYDIGPGAGSFGAKEFAEKNQNRLTRDIKITTGFGEGRFVAIRINRDAKIAAVFEAQAGVNFYAVNITEKQVNVFESIVRSLLVDPEPNPKKQDVQQPSTGQPAPRPGSTSEDNGKSHPAPEQPSQRPQTSPSAEK
jgi:hypothetical protein